MPRPVELEARLDGTVLRGRIISDTGPVTEKGRSLVKLFPRDADQEGAAIARVVAADDGSFALSPVSPGRYRIETIRIGFEPVSHPVEAGQAGSFELRIPMYPMVWGPIETPILAFPRKSPPKPPSVVITGHIRCTHSDRRLPTKLVVALAGGAVGQEPQANVARDGTYRLEGSWLDDKRSIEVRRGHTILAKRAVRTERPLIDSIRMTKPC